MNGLVVLGVLFWLGAASFFAVSADTDSVFHELEALILVLSGTVAISSAAIIGAVNRLGAKLTQPPQNTAPHQHAPPHGHYAPPPQPRR